MAYPPSPIEADVTNVTPTPDLHPLLHNELATAVGDIVAELGADPKGSAADVTARLASLLVAGSTATFANLAALPAASAHTNEIVKTVDGGVYESTGSAWVQLVPPSGTYELHPAGGIDGQALIKDSTTPTGNRWAAGGGGGGGSDANFVFQQATPSASWTVTHNLAKRPCVDVVDASGNVVLADVQYLSDNALVVSFSAAIAGAAYVN